MILGSHVIVYSRDAEADRAFFADVLGHPHVDAGGGWLIFRVPPAELCTRPMVRPGMSCTSCATTWKPR
jgi:catechol 2,3-dioxygenase-like lactoylglutathione lyase family enzyme